MIIIPGTLQRIFIGSLNLTFPGTKSGVIPVKSTTLSIRWASLDPTSFELYAACLHFVLYLLENLHMGPAEKLACGWFSVWGGNNFRDLTSMDHWFGKIHQLSNSHRILCGNHRLLQTWTRQWLSCDSKEKACKARCS